MSNEGFYDHQYNWSVEHYHGQWVMVSRQSHHQLAETPKVIAAIHALAASNKEKFSSMNRTNALKCG